MTLLIAPRMIEEMEVSYEANHIASFGLGDAAQRYLANNDRQARVMLRINYDKIAGNARLTDIDNVSMARILGGRGQVTALSIAPVSNEDWPMLGEIRGTLIEAERDIARQQVLLYMLGQFQYHAEHSSIWGAFTSAMQLPDLQVLGRNERMVIVPPGKQIEVRIHGREVLHFANDTRMYYILDSKSWQLIGAAPDAEAAEITTWVRSKRNGFMPYNLLRVNVDVSAFWRASDNLFQAYGPRDVAFSFSDMEASVKPAETVYKFKRRIQLEE